MRIDEFIQSKKFRILVLSLIALAIAGWLVFVFNRGLDDALNESNTVSQRNAIEERFHENKDRYVKTRAQVSRDDGGNFYYILYSEGNLGQAVREVWDGGDSQTPEIRYHFFDNAELALVRRFRGNARDLDALIEGSDENIIPLDILFFENSSMWKWIGADGMAISREDSKWESIEKSTLLSVDYFVDGLEQTEF